MKFRFSFPVLDSLTRNIYALGIITLVLAAISYFVSPHLPFVLLLTFLMLLAFKLDMPVSRQILLSPSVLFLAHTWIRLGLGMLFLATTLEAHESSGFLLSQIGGLVFFVFAIIGIKVSGISRRQIYFPLNNHDFKHEVLRPLTYLGFFCICYVSLSTFVALASGVGDRGFAGADAGGGIGAFSLWTPLSAMHRFRAVAFILVPLMMRSRIPVIALMVPFLAGGSLFLSLINGDRGYVMWSILAIAFGYYLFTDRPRIRIERAAIFLAPIFAVFIFVVGIFRSTDAFIESRALDIGARVEAFAEVKEAIDQKAAESQFYGWHNSAVEEVAKRLYGGFDHLIFSMTPRVFPHAWFDGFSAMPHVWLPYSLFGMRERAAAMADGYFIASTYRGSYGDGRTRYGISMNADLYRRFGWFGMPIAAMLLGFMYGIYWKIGLYIYYHKSAFLGTLFILLMFTLFFGKTHTTIMSSWKIFAYDIPKHMIMALPLWFLFRNSSRPALAYR